MGYFDYKAVPAPRRLKRAKGVSDAEELFALTLTEAINEQGRQGWEYIRSETLTAETPGGWFRRSREESHAVLVFRRERDTLGPRIAPVAEAAPASGPDLRLAVEPAAALRPSAAHSMPAARAAGRREPVLDAGPEPRSEPSQPDAPMVPRLGPAD